MSKICINCGAELEDQAVFCGKCGTCQEGQPVKSDRENVMTIPEKKKHTIFSVLGMIILIFGVIFFALMTLLLLILKGYVSAVICLAVTILLIPPVYHKIIKFPGKNLISSLVCIIAFFAAVLLVPAESLSSSKEVNDKEVVETFNENEETTIKLSDDKEDIEEVVTNEEVPEVLDEGIIEDEIPTYDGFDSLSRYDWIDKNINLGAAGEEFDYIGVEKWGEDKSNEAVAAFYLDWYDVVSYNLNNNYNLNNLNLEENTDLLLGFCNYIQSAKYLFDIVYPDCIIVNVEIYPYIDTAVETGNRYYDSILNNQNDKYRRFFEFNSQWETVVNIFDAIER